MKKAVFPLLSLIFIIICAVLVYQERNRVPVYVELIPDAVISDTEKEIPAEAGFQAVNINSGGLEELMTLQGIGEVIAQRIIDYREKHGDFMSKEELMDVSGIGEKIFDSIKDKITI